MIFYERRRGGWAEKHITIDNAEQIKKLIIVSVLTGGCFEIENQEEAQKLISFLPDLEGPFKREAMRALAAFRAAIEFLS
jgi:hypothetical protein